MKSTLEEQQAFVTVVDSGSITGAAERLGITVSGVSRSLNRLEQKLGATLLRRTTRRLELTEEGETFLNHCRRILAAVEEAEEAMLDRHNQPQGRLRVNAAPSFMQFVIVPVIGEFRARYPGITLELDTHDRFVDLLEQRVDLAIRIGDLEDSSLHARLLGHSPLRLLGLQRQHANRAGHRRRRHCLPGRLYDHRSPPEGVTDRRIARPHRAAYSSGQRRLLPTSHTFSAHSLIYGVSGRTVTREVFARIKGEPTLLHCVPKELQHRALIPLSLDPTIGEYLACAMSLRLAALARQRPTTK
jgi:DNA-binding transcriptional LysR family regulator